MQTITNELNNYILNEDNMNSYLKYKHIQPTTSVDNILLMDTLHDNNTDNDTQHKIKNTVNNIFFPQQKINYEITEPPKLPLPTYNTKPSHSCFIPKQQDSLFWCYYIIANGELDYEMLFLKNSLIAKQIKFKYVEKIRNNKQIIKTYKFDTITNIESNLVNDNIINIKTIMSLCAIDNINVVFITNKCTYFELLMNDTKPVYIIREFDFQSKYNKQFGFEIVNASMLEHIRNTLYRVDSLNKPIKSLSSYKIQDLINISNKLKIELTNKETGKKLIKNQIYELIIQKIQ